MTNKIQKIFEKYPHPDQKLLPKIYLAWNTSNGRNYLDCKTGIVTSAIKKDISYNNSVSYDNMKQECYCVNIGATLKYAYFKYHSAAKLLELAVVTMNSTKRRGARLWEYADEGERYFIDKDKNIYAVDGVKNPADRFQAYKYHAAYRFDLYLNMLLRCSYNECLMEEFKKLIGTDTIIVGNGRCITLTYPWSIVEWYKTKKYKETNGKVQQLLNKITSLPHTDLTDICENFKPISYKSSEWYTRNVNDVIYFEQLNDEWSVLRYCTRKPDNGNIEAYRVYIAEDGTCKMAKLNDCDKWIPAQNKSDGWRSSYGRIVNFDDMLKSKRLSYIMPVLKKIPEHRQLPAVVSIIKFPEIEKLYKLGYEHVAQHLIENNTVNANMKEMFGELNKNAKTIFGEFGLNKHQFDIWVQSYNTPNFRSYYSTSIKTFRKYFGNDISSMDDETFTNILTCIARIKQRSWYGVEGVINIINVDGKKLLKNMSRLLLKHSDRENLLSLFNDTVNSYRRINHASRPEIDWMFDSYSDLVRTHDALVEIYGIQEAERRVLQNASEAERRKKEDEKRQKIDEKRKCYEYEENNYIIRLPKNVNEIVDEGLKQRICIGGYTGRHSNGDTNLFFLRSKETPDIPFYAIEMDNNKRIIQIHGFGNKWLGNDPAAIPTVVRWLRKNDIKCNDKILTCTSTGYGGNGTYIAMPVVD